MHSHHYNMSMLSTSIIILITLYLKEFSYIKHTVTSHLRLKIFILTNSSSAVMAAFFFFPPLFSFSLKLEALLTHT